MPNSVDDLSYSRDALNSKKPRLRAIIGVRQSKKKDASESPATQEAESRAWCARMDIEVVHVTKDIGVSAQKSPFDRKGLGPWLSEPEKLVQWDLLVVWRLDRLVRSTTHFYGEFAGFLKETGKHAVSVTENLDTRTVRASELAFRISFAEEELEARRDRATSSRKGLRYLGRWAGGVPPFGWQSAKRPQGGWGLVIDEDAQDVLYQIRDILRQGENESGVGAKANVNRVITWLNQEQIPTSYDWNRRRKGEPMEGHLWHWTNMVKLLTRHSLLGVETHKGEIVRDETGNPVRFSPVGLFTREEWDEIGAIVTGRRLNHMSARHASLLSGAFLCGCCDGPVYHNAAQVKSNEGDPRRGPTLNKARYGCSTRRKPGVGKERCQAGTWRADEIEPAVVEMFLAKYGHLEVHEVKCGNPTDYSSEITELEESLTALDIDYYEKGKFKGDAGERRYEQIKARMETKLEELGALQATYGKVERIGTGQTYREQWEACRTVEERNRMFRRVGLVVKAKRPARGEAPFPSEISVELPEVAHVLAA